MTAVPPRVESAVKVAAVMMQRPLLQPLVAIEVRRTVEALAHYARRVAEEEPEADVLPPHGKVDPPQELV